MSNSTLIYIVRHGESEANRQHILGGQTDFPLTARGEEQARQARDRLAGIKFDEIYASDLQRAYRTAEIIADRPVKPSHRLKGLRERTYGRLEGGSANKLDESEGVKRTLNDQEKWDFRNVEGMETDKELHLRFFAELESIAKNNPGKTVLVAAHGGPIRMLLMVLMGKSHDDLPRGSFKNAEYLELEYSESQGLMSRTGRVSITFSGA